MQALFTSINRLCALFLFCRHLLLDPKAIPKKCRKAFYMRMKQDWALLWLFLGASAQIIASETKAPLIQASERAAFESAVANVILNISVPVSTEGSQDIDVVKLFPWIQQQIQQAGFRSKVNPSNVMLRRVMSFVYSKIYEAKRTNQSSAQVLEKLNSSTASIPFSQLFGPNEVLRVDVAGVDSEKAKALIETKTQIKLRKSQLTQTLHRRNYEAPIDVQRVSVSSDSDQVVMKMNTSLESIKIDLKKKKLVPSGNHSKTQPVELFYAGKFNYVSDSTEPVEAALQGAKAMHEFPFLEPTDSAILEADLRRITEQLKDRKLSMNDRLELAEKLSTLLEDFQGKFARAWDNQFANASEGTLRAAVRQIDREQAKTRHAYNKYSSPISENDLLHFNMTYLKAIPISQRKIEEPNLISKNFVLTTSQYLDLIKNEDGIFWHGTRSPDTLHKIYTEGPASATTALRGDGFYITPNTQDATFWASHKKPGGRHFHPSEANLAAFRIRRDARILVWGDRLTKTKEFKDLVQSLGMTPNFTSYASPEAIYVQNVIAEKMGIDVVMAEPPAGEALDPSRDDYYIRHIIRNSDAFDLIPPDLVLHEKLSASNDHYDKVKTEDVELALKLNGYDSTNTWDANLPKTTEQSDDSDIKKTKPKTKNETKVTAGKALSVKECNDLYSGLARKKSIVVEPELDAGAVH